MVSSGLDLRADILKVAHHGSHSSSSLAFLAAANPAVAIYSAGAGNDYGHPHDETLENLAEVGAQIYGTNINGTIIVSSDGTSYTVQPAEQSQSQTPSVAQSTGIPQPSTINRGCLIDQPIAPGSVSSLTIKNCSWSRLYNNRLLQIRSKPSSRTWPTNCRQRRICHMVMESRKKYYSG